MLQRQPVATRMALYKYEDQATFFPDSWSGLGTRREAPVKNIS